MASSTPSHPDDILAHVRVLRLTDKILAVADELRDARAKLQAVLDRVAAAPRDDSRGEGRRDG
jgi:hypothetical protein